MTCESIACVETLVCLNISIISASFSLKTGREVIEVGVSSGTGLFMTSAILGFCLASKVFGVGGWIARWAILGVVFPLAVTSVLMDRSLTFLLEDDAGGEGGEESVEFNDEVRSGGVLGTGLFSFARLSRLGGIGIVGLSGTGDLLSLLPCLYAGGTPRCSTESGTGCV